MRGVANLGFLAFGPHDGDHVETARGLRDAVAAKVELRRLGDLMLLEVVDLVFGRRIVFAAGLHFAEHERAAVAGDDVDFAEGAAEVADEDLVAALAEESCGAVLAT